MIKYCMTAGILALTFATSPVFADVGDRIDDRFDRRGDRIDNRLDRKGDRIDDRLDRRGDRLENRFDARADRAAANGRDGLANRLERQGNRRSPAG